ncbi:MAG: tRNA (adenosine(37)-N6)-threonylcarbamoyltransferase complex ATPase subunit type 1 TsaE [Flaviramulus sp.]|nr:tRNA (adenosine(37)-N6)-threonylcarbamoyltransferase complex ATPase subunit type 1 TsaE [Flaviramulus sp.]NNC50672.1 tRNA (adenosine(37)-N6)-threonylcarbamoyltransferase complex ATPase subunit type 1 TsaE [Flaviramulus sp.]
MKIGYQLNEVENVVNQLIANLKTRTILFYGDMGVGKTTLIKALVNVLGSDDEASSPTFSIVNEYSKGLDKIYHFDLYRIKDLEEAYNFGIEDYLDSENWKFIEWPEKIEAILYNEYDRIDLKMNGPNKRILTLS